MSQQDLTRQAIILGALLHDIGKFVQRAEINPREQKHTYWGEKWFTDNFSEKLTPIFGKELTQQISSMINCHHDGERYISLADGISAGMERIPIEDEEDPFTDRLISIFSRISISDKPKKDKYYKLSVLGEDNFEEIFPIGDKKCTSKEYSDLLDKFNKEIKQLNYLNSTSQQIIEQIYFLLWKYTWCIPSAAYKYEPDISLFDHLKTTAAITTCLYDYHQENPAETLNIDTKAFQLIAGDISGTQSYIFEALSHQGKVAKRLRARSFYIQLVSEIAAHKIIHKFNLPFCNILSLAGGNFYILLPNLNDALDRFKELQKEFNEWTYSNFKGEIYLSIENISATGRDLSKYDNLLDNLKQRIQVKKYQAFSSILISDKKWNDNFKLDEVIEGDEKICQSCHKHPAIKENQEKDRLCEWCFNDEKIGEKIPKAKFIAFFKNEKDGYPVLRYSFKLLENYSEKKSSYLTYALNDTSFIQAGFKFLANHIPIEKQVRCNMPEHQHLEDQPLFFDCLANISEGDALLGYLKADVDNMGKILKYGFQNTRPSISRYVSLSRMLENFFSGYFQKRLEKDFRDIYTIFSGGDDFFVVGPWNRVIEFAKELRKQFTEFTGENSDFTFSAGVIFAKPYEPISFCADYVKEELKKSKDFSEEKNKITFLGQTIKWEDLDKVLSEAQRVIDWLQSEPPVVSRGFIYNLRKYSQMAQEYEKTKNTKYLKYVSLLNYDIYRNLTKEEQKEAKEWAIRLSPLFKKSKEEDILPFLRVILEYVLIWTRRRIK